MIRRLMMAMAVLAAGLSLGWTGAARADDISAAARGVVRIVTIAQADNGEIVGFGHGSGFAVAPNRVVTNYHVIQLATRYPQNVVIGVVPSEGDKSFQGKLIAWDQQRDLALIEFSGVRLPVLTLFGGPVSDGASMIALGYPGNVDLATARSAADYITPQSPVRSQGTFSGMRKIEGTNVLLHTAGIARGNSGGPVLDPCGRVVGVNEAVTNAEQGDSTFAFAISQPELVAFLEENKQGFAAVSGPCTTFEEQQALDRNAEAAAQAQADAKSRQDAAKAAAERQDALERARASNERTRENFMAIAAVMLVLGGLCIGGAALLYTRDRQREAVWVGIGGGVLFLGAIALFLARPDFDESKIVPVEGPSNASEAAALTTGKMVCTLQRDRGRVILTNQDTVTLDFGLDGCVNSRTQYAETGSHWQRILVPGEEQTVSVLDYDPASQTYTNTRYLLSAEQMERARQLRAEVKLKACSTDQAARGQLATQQQSIRAALPPAYNEKLIYSCAPAAASDAAPASPPPADK